ncbi:MMPL family transporter [Nocardia puris]|uniref:RND superfamily putative drug exporter n=1 Tax=Nocardia puris TaxID=208602 RepID=A0A366D0B7_9NOCA|nr:MMPL family transporter [Nocardia puris]RBO82949.1 RND superfamily putative drug exporter [Nocardia puris]
MTLWDRYASFVTAHRSWWLLVVLGAVAFGAIGLVGENESAGAAPDSLPPASQSARVDQVASEFPGADTASAVVVVTRLDGATLTESDIAAAEGAIARTGADIAAARVRMAPDGVAAVGTVAVPAELNGFALTDEIARIRAAVGDGLPAELKAQVTGGPAFGADIADSFSGANTTLLLVTALVVALLLIVTYRSPVLWLIPLLIVGFADRLATSVGTALASVTDLSFDGSTSGITSVLVFGAGTNYALLLVSRYRDELRVESDHRVALRRACRRAGPAILASNLTVVVALSILLLATLPSTRSLGASAAAGLLVVVVFVLLGLPAALAVCGRGVFWPFVPRVGGGDHAEQGVWHTIATRVVRGPVAVVSVALAGLAVCAAGLFTVDVGLSQTEQFRVRAESVDGLATLSAHFPAGSADPVVVVARGDVAARVERVLAETPGVQQVSGTGETSGGLSRWAVVIDAEPQSDRAFRQIETLRERLADVPGAHAWVGGSDAEALDTDAAASRDRAVVIPLILAAVLVILLVLLRAVPAALVLVAVTVLSALAALGVGTWASVHLFGFPAVDTGVPLFAFLFLVALGVDYSIFLVVRAREETPGHGTTRGIVRAVATTGTVITSAGLVLAAVFCVLGVLPLITLTQLGIVVGLGILLDTFVVRTVIIPALFAIVGDRIWWPSRPRRAVALQK